MKSVFGFRVRLQNPKSGFPTERKGEGLTGSDYRRVTMVLHFAFMSEVLFDNSEVPFLGSFRLRPQGFETASFSHESAFRPLELNLLNFKLKI